MATRVHGRTAMSLLTIVFVGLLAIGALRAFAGSPGVAFEIDGNTVDGALPATDWDAGGGLAWTDASAQVEDQIVPGNKLLLNYPWPINSGNVNNKTDLTGARFKTLIDADGDLILAMAATRLPATGNASATFSLNQSATGLTAGDLIVQMDWVNGGGTQAPNIRVRGAADWSLPTAPPSTIATAFASRDGTFVEAAVNLTDFQAQNPAISCFNITRIWVLTQTSQSDTANLEDMLDNTADGPQTIDLSTCASVKVKKVVVPADASEWNMSVTPTLVASPPQVIGHNGTTTAFTVQPGTTITVAEAAGAGTNLANYTTTVACTNDATGASLNITPAPGNQSLTMQLAPLTQATCTFTNTLKSGKLELKKAWVGTAGSTTLRIGTGSNGSEITSLPVSGANGTTGEQVLPVGTYYVSETTPTVAGGTYNASLSCFGDLNNDGAKNGNEVSLVPGANQSVPVALGDDVVCTFTNEFVPTPVVNVTKTATTSLTRTFDWTLTKEVSIDAGVTWLPSVAVNKLIGGSQDYLWRLTWTRGAPVDSNHVVAGTITVTNPGATPVTVNSVADDLTLGGPIPTVVACAAITFPRVVAAGDSFACSYTTQGAIPASNGSNIASAVVENGANDVTYPSPSVPIDWAAAKVTTVDNAASITDANVPALSQSNVVASGSATSTTQTVRCGQTTTITNSATLTEGNSQQARDASASITINCSASPAPAISIKKFTNGADADVAPGPSITVGQAVTWTYIVTNTGNVPLTSVTVSDDKLGAVTCPKSTLAVAESMTCSMSGTATLGQYANVGTASDSQSEISASDLSHYLGVNPPPPGCQVNCGGGGGGGGSSSTPSPTPTPAPPVVQVLGSSAQITKVLASANPARVGERVAFDVGLTITGDTQVTGVTLTDTYENGYLQFVSSSPAGCITVPGVPDAAHSQVRCALGDVTPGSPGNPGSQSFAYKFTFEALAVTPRTVDAVIANADLDGTGPAGPATIGPATAEVAIIGLPITLPRAGLGGLARFIPPWPVLLALAALAPMAGAIASRRRQARGLRLR